MGGRGGGERENKNCSYETSTSNETDSGDKRIKVVLCADEPTEG